MNIITDIHHHGLPRCNAVTSIDYRKKLPCGDFKLSIGMHPWDTANSEFDFDFLAEQASLPQVVAIGETGIDKLRGADITIQRNIFTCHAKLADKLNKPLIIHAVKSTDIILELAKKTKHYVPWAIHGFRGNAITAQQLVKAGFYISFGERFNSETVKSVPIEKILAETDESTVGIEQVIKNIATAKDIETDVLNHMITNNTKTFISASLSNS